jgi:hypothetical protein
MNATRDSGGEFGYAKFAKEAPELQLKQFFSSLVDIEIDHLELRAEYLKQ